MLYSRRVVMIIFGLVVLIFLIVATVVFFLMKMFGWGGRG